MYWNYFAVLGLFLPVSIVLGFYMYIGIFNRLLADDYCCIYYGRRLGLFRSIWYWYITLHGGFSVSAADWFLSFTGPGLLPFMAIITLSTWISIAVFIWRRIFFTGDFTKEALFYSLLLGIVLVYATLVISPEITQSFFWWGGARGYFLPLIFASLFIMISAWSETQFLVSIHQDHVSFARKWDWVDAKIKKAKQSGTEEVYIPSMENWAGLEYPKNRSKYWVNVCFDQYYGINVFAPPQGE